MLGAITVSYNDGYKLKEWKEYYSQISEYIDNYIIVDNGSEDEYKKELKRTFPKAKIIFLQENRGSTGAYNRGIEYLLKETNADHIMLYGNDIKIDVDSIKKLINCLDEYGDIGMVSPILLRKDSWIVEDGGCKINRRDFSLKPQDVGREYNEVPHDSIIVDTVTGGINIARASFYKKAGLQDERLFMYSDEVDMGIRAKEAGFRMMMVRSAIAWHQHKNIDNSANRHPYSAYLMARNKVYLAYKHSGIISAIRLFSLYLVKDVVQLIRFSIKRQKEKCKWYRWHLCGALFGICRNMGSNKYSKV